MRDVKSGDSIVLVRYLGQDHPQQSARAGWLIEQELSEEHPGFVGPVVIGKSVWRAVRAAMSLVA